MEMNDNTDFTLPHTHTHTHTQRHAHTQLMEIYPSVSLVKTI